ncbi:DNA-binding transcriptional regulator, MarR family [Evansella caseinilytica]|uniref:DNA-binding transcriptional regulator, MarR family n=1 Tax=Evansella caseinilytica TaxID=1503961 RepID=A0A1H3TNU5_9BACI|nr:MarR family transcriptional regulator [Evansella caseinilytica]SDZ51568.1 DNA-binding transcriptional regulator, MarR family [Evansella caseinilytica]
MAEITKRLIHEMYMKLVHLNEQKAGADLQAFFAQASAEKLPLLPKNLTSIHVIHCIGNHEPINNTSIAQKMSLSKANITKISSKLLKEGLIKRFQLTDNKKEVFFRLTPAGKEVFALHEKLHKKKEQLFYQLLDRYTEAEQAIVLRFLQELTDQLVEELPEARRECDSQP